MKDKELTLMELDTLIGRLTSEKKGNDVKMNEQDIKCVVQHARQIFL